MSKLIDIYLEAVFFVVSIILWLYVLLISSDIPVNISKNEFIISIIENSRQNERVSSSFRSI